MCDVLSLLNDVVADIATIKPDCSEPELNDDPYKLLKSSELESMMVELCGVDIGEESRKLMRAMTAKVEPIFEIREYRGWCSAGSMISMRRQLWHMLPKYNNMQMSKFGVASALYEEIGVWNPHKPRSSVSDVITSYYVWLNEQAKRRHPDVTHHKRISCIQDAVTLILIKALEFTVKEYGDELGRENDDVGMLSNGDIPF